MTISRLLALLLPVLLLSACKSTRETDPAYDLAQQCVAIRNLASGDYLMTAGETRYRFAPGSEPAAEKFFLKPSGLGTFLLYDREARLLGKQLIRVSREPVASPQTEWRIHHLELLQNRQPVAHAFTLVSVVDSLRLQQGKTGPVLRGGEASASVNAALELIPQPDSACRTFPEAPLDATVAADFYSPRDPAAPVTGYADLHTHLGFPQSMAGLAMAGDLFHPWGIEHALKDCAHLHGKQGILDLLEGQRASGGGGGHDTAGYPDFPYWPRRDTSTHVQAYYRWLQRAHLAGLRLLVTHATGNPTFCQLLSLMKPGRAEGDCSSRSEVENQTRYLYAMQDYIDAQEGGPGQGWFRVAGSAAEARAIIARNKLAVVPGAEYGTLFDCNASATFCTPDYIDQQLEQIHRLGIRVVFPIHRFDNAFGGTRPAGGVAGAWMNLASKLNTSEAPAITRMLDPFGYLFKPIGGHFWELQPCPEGIEGTGDLLGMDRFIGQDVRGLIESATAGSDIGPLVNTLVDRAFLRKLEPLPDYAGFDHPDSHACNLTPLQPAGRYLVNRLIDRGMLIDIDHMGYSTQMDTLDILEQRQYGGVVSSHGWMESNADIRQRLFRLGGQISPFNHRPGDNAAVMKQYKQEMEGFGFPVGIGMGSDVQGVTAQTDGDPGVQIEYPFGSVDGQVHFTRPATGNRVFDYTRDGVAHYGLMAEWVENLRQLDARDPEDLMGIFMNSAEAFLQMWERAEARAQN